VLPQIRQGSPIIALSPLGLRSKGRPCRALVSIFRIDISPVNGVPLRGFSIPGMDGLQGAKRGALGGSVSVTRDRRAG